MVALSASRCAMRMSGNSSLSGVFVAVTVLVWCVAAAGCAEAESIVYYDSDGLEEAIPGKLVPDYPDMVTDVECPEMVERRSVSMSCAVEIGGVAVVVTVDIDERGRADLLVEDIFLLEVAELASHSAQRLESDGFGPVEVECDSQPVLVAVAGDQLDCDAVDPSGDRRPLVVTITSDQGDWKLSLRPM